MSTPCDHLHGYPFGSHIHERVRADVSVELSALRTLQLHMREEGAENSEQQRDGM